MECDQIDSERQLFQHRFRIVLLQPNSTSSNDPTNERSSVGESTSVEGRLFGEMTHAVEDSSDESSERFGGQFFWNDLRFDSSQDGCTQRDL